MSFAANTDRPGTPQHDDPRPPGEHKVIILGCTQGGTAVARSLDPLGVRLLVLTCVSRDPGLSSRHVRNWRICPHPRDEEKFLEYVEQLGDDWKGALIISTTDYFARAVSRNRERLERSFRVSDPEWRHARIFLEKDLTYRLADEVGVPHPAYFRPNSLDDLEQEIPRLKLPIMIKPVHSDRFTEVFATKLFINRTFDELRENYRRCLDAGMEVFVCEIIPGTDYKTLETVQLYIDSRGDVAARFCCIKLRQTPPMYGVIRVGKSMEPSAELIEPALRLLQHVDYRGYASVEFKRDPRDGQLKLIEVNIRTLQMAQLPIGSGVDFPKLMFRDFVLNEQATVGDYDPNTYYIDLVADVADAIRYDTDRSIRRYLEPYLTRRKVFAYLRFSDPMPFLSHLIGGSLHAMRKARAKRRS